MSFGALRAAGKLKVLPESKTCISRAVSLALSRSTAGNTAPAAGKMRARWHQLLHLVELLEEESVRIHGNAAGGRHGQAVGESVRH